MPSLIRFLCGAAADFSCGSAPSATVAPRQAAAEKKDLRFNINAFSSGLQVECRYHNRRREGKLEPRIASDALWLTSRDSRGLLGIFILIDFGPGTLDCGLQTYGHRAKPSAKNCAWFLHFLAAFRAATPGVRFGERCRGSVDVGHV